MIATERIAVVTGGAKGIGAAVSRRLSGDGMAVAVLDLDGDAASAVAQELTSSGGRAIARVVDVTDEDSVEGAVQGVADQLGAPTVLVNNAGIIRDNLLFKMSVNDWDQVIAVHLRGAFLMSRAVQSHMTQQRFGRIVTMSSTSGLGNRGQANYAAAKAGLEGFTRTLAIELGQFGITANAIAPGFIATDMLKATAARIGISYEKFLAQGAEKAAVQRYGTPEDVAHTASFLASDGAGYVTGQIIYVAGGPYA